MLRGNCEAEGRARWAKQKIVEEANAWRSTSTKRCYKQIRLLKCFSILCQNTCWTQKPASNDNALGNRNYCITSATIIWVPGHGRCIVEAAQHSSWENRTIDHDSLCHVWSYRYKLSLIPRMKCCYVHTRLPLNQFYCSYKLIRKTRVFLIKLGSGCSQVLFMFHVFLMLVEW